MIAPLAPETETERLADLYALKLLDTPSEERFDRIVNLSKKVFNVPIAYIALIDSDRQWFKAKTGMCDILTETPRSTSFCGHTILQEQPLIIEDALKDERFHDNPMVTGEPYVRFYAGHPLRGEQGHNIATLCLVDTRPRPLSEPELEVFHSLAALAEHELNMFGLIEAQRELLDTKNALVASQQRLAGELAEAAEYVRSFLPQREAGLNDHVRFDYQFIESSQLGGDLLGYHQLDDDQMAFWLLDVTGHGVGASLLSASVGNAIRSGVLTTEMDNPAKVLDRLNLAFPMAQHDNRFFTIWYGVYHQPTRSLRFSAGGHHPALLVGPDGQARRLGSPGLMIGAVDDARYDNDQTALEPGSRLYLYSDGLFEVRGGNENKLLGLNGINDILTQAQPGQTTRVQQVLQAVRSYTGQTQGFVDDVSLLEVEIAG
ncbi:MAG: GAF domain-containing SpoIIE family protein phosphatase [Planctomycetota bacterium]